MRYSSRVFCGLVVLALIAPWVSAQDKEPLPAGALARIGTTRYQVSRHRNAHLLSPDGKLLAVSMPSEGIYVWRLPAWTLDHFIQVDRIDPEVNARFDCPVFTPDSKKLLIFNANTDQILVYDAAARKIAKRIAVPTDGPIADAALMPMRDQNAFVFTWDDTNIRKQRFVVFDLENGLVKHSRKLEGDRHPQGPQFTLASDGRVVWQRTSADKQSLEVWDLASGKAQKTFASVKTLRKLLVSPDGKTLLAHDVNFLACNFDLHSGAKRPRSLDDKGAPVAFAPDSKSFYLANGDGILHRFKTADNTLLATHAPPVRCTISQVAFGADGKALALGMGNATLYLWEVETGKLLSPVDVPSGGVMQLAFTSPDELFIAAENGHAAWWQPRSGVKLRDLKLTRPDAKDPKTQRPVRLDGRPLIISANGKFVALDGGAQVAFFDAESGQFLYDKESVGSLSSIRFYADRKTTIDIMPSMQFFEDGKKVASFDHARIQMWDARSGKELSRIDTPFTRLRTSRTSSISHNGRFVANFGANQVISLWDMKRTNALENRVLTGETEGFAFSPDDRWLAVNDGKNRLLLARVGSKRTDFDKELRHAGQDVTAFAFAPDGRQLAVAVVDPFASPLVNRILIYEMSSKRIRLELPGHPEGAVESLAYAPGSGLLASAATDGMVLVWKSGLPAPAKAPGRKLTAKELDAGFNELAGNDAQAAFQAMIKLAEAPSHTTEFFARKIAPTPKLDLEGRTLAQWINDLGSKTFSVRSKANATLFRIGTGAENDLRAALQRGPDLETKRRIEDLLDRIAAAEEPSPQDIMHARAVEVLETIATPEARALLTRWSEGDAGAVLTQEARKTLKQMK